ncbi:MAG: YkgJ family cysteine cluster protein [Lachnospiraceae bacterium]|nr:YkgJ family cysteine cluster protein [Lachnospiraceae bacterium]
MKEDILFKLKELALDSGQTAHTYEFKNEMPKANNGVGLKKWLTNEIEEINDCINALESKHGLQSVCKKGCSDCCKQFIVLTQPECVAIEAYINNLDYETREYLKKKTQETSLLLEENEINMSLVNNLNPRNYSFTFQKSIQERYFNLNIPCIFLNEKNECLIHPVRPSLCWSYREYYDSYKCKSCFSDTGFKYDDWEAKSTQRLFSARPFHTGLLIMPYAIKKIMHW